MDSFYDVYELIGEGSFGKVYRARCRRTNTQVAYKVISKNCRSLPEVHALRRECEIQKSLWHPNIIRMLNSFENDKELVVITEFAQKDLCHILKENGALGENKSRKLICDLVSALYYLHSNRILHRDLKPQNVLLDGNGNAKLCDFGFAKVLCRDKEMLTSIKGTPLYMAPELMHEHPYDHNADLWSLGCIAYELVTGHPPYTTSSILQLIAMVKLQPIKWPQYLSQTCLSFLKGLLNKNPNSRLTWPYLLYHQFITSNIYPNLAFSADYQNNYDLPKAFPVGYQPVPVSLPPMNHTSKPSIVSNTDKYEPTHVIEIKNQRARDSGNSQVHDSENWTPDACVLAQKEEWLECLRKTISNLMYDGDVDELTEKHSLMLIMNTFNTHSKCPVIVTTVSRLLSLPFVVESVSDTQLLQIRETYGSCNIMRDLLLVVKDLISSSEEKKLNTHQEVAFQQLLLLICNLIFTDSVLLQQFFKVCVPLNLFKNLKVCLVYRTKNDPYSIAKYFISIFLRLYIFIPQSRQFISQAFEDCVTEFHLLLQTADDTKIRLKLCTLITILSCTQPNFLHRSTDVDTLVNDLSKLNVNSNVPSTQQITNGALEALKNL